MDEIFIVGPRGAGMTTALEAIFYTVQGAILPRGPQTCIARVMRGEHAWAALPGAYAHLQVTFLRENRSWLAHEGRPAAEALAWEIKWRPEKLALLNQFWADGGPQGWPCNDGHPLALEDRASVRTEWVWHDTPRLELHRTRRGKTLAVPAEALSAQELDALELVVPFLARPTPEIVVIDKPELHLGAMRGSSAAYRLLLALRRLAPDAQFIVGTHDDELLSHFFQFQQMDLAALCFTDEELRARAGRRMEEQRND